MADIAFLCVHNAGRSQMAEALFNRLAEERGLALRAESAGTAPAERVHPNVVQVMREAGMDLSERAPRLLTDGMVERAGRVVTMGCSPDAGACPAILYAEVEDWGLPDPAGRPLAEVRAIRDEIAARVERLIDSLTAGRS
ncbi:MAG: arsenate reductase ArsC [Gemmatimonadetes bacterium]|nr:arsenate reductase ArsC [Gemmatimonadota bacterium]